MCRGEPVCAVSPTPTLNAFRYASEGFPGGIADERQVFLAQEVGPNEWVQRVHDPLQVRPGDRIRVAGLVDYGAVPNRERSTARGVRALVALPPGNRRRLVLFASVSGDNTTPTAVSDPVVIGSRDPIYVRFEQSTAYLLRRGHGVHRISDNLVTLYDTTSFDRRQLASQGTRIGCHKPDGRLPAGPGCTTQFQAILDVRYAATADAENGVGDPDSASADVTALVRGRFSYYTHPAPRFESSPNRLTTIQGGRHIYLDCQIRVHNQLWYRVSDPANISDDAFDAGFTLASRLSHVSGGLPQCQR